MGAVTKLPTSALAVEMASRIRGQIAAVEARGQRVRRLRDALEQERASLILWQIMRAD